MSKQQLLALAFLLVGVVLAVVFIMLRPESPSVAISASEEARFADATVINYRNETGAELSVAYVGDLARVTGGAYDGVTLRQVESASGAKYEGEAGLILWSKNDEVRIETAQQLAYQGVAIVPPTEEPVPNEPVPVESATTSTTTSALPDGVVDVVWQWKEATKADGEVITPNKPEAFTVRFTSAGGVEGATDCNGFGGGYTTAADGQIVFGEFMSTLMYCDGSQEQVFTGLLVGGVQVSSITTDTLTLENVAGDTIVFTRSDN